MPLPKPLTLLLASVVLLVITGRNPAGSQETAPKHKETTPKHEENPPNARQGVMSSRSRHDITGRRLREKQLLMMTTERGMNILQLSGILARNLQLLQALHPRWAIEYSM